MSKKTDRADNNKRTKKPDPSPFVQQFNVHEMERVVTGSAEVYVFCGAHNEYKFRHPIDERFANIQYVRSRFEHKEIERSMHVLVQAYIASLDSGDLNNYNITPITPRYVVTTMDSYRHLLSLYTICDATCNILTFQGLNVLWNPAFLPRPENQRLIEWEIDPTSPQNKFYGKFSKNGYRVHKVNYMSYQLEYIQNYLATKEEEQ